MSEKIDFKKLAEPFPEEDIEWRLERAGETNGKIWAFCLAYVTNRAIMQRLDDIVGPENWRNQFATAPEGGFMCGIYIKVDGEWIDKWDGADKTQVEAVKGGFSGSMKRAAVQWGIGRYLYNIESNFASIVDKGKGKFKGKTKENKWFEWNPPQMPSWALPKGCEGKKAVEDIKKVWPGAQEVTIKSFSKMILEAKNKADQKEVWKRYWNIVKPMCSEKELIDFGEVHKKINK